MYPLNIPRDGRLEAREREIKTRMLAKGQREVNSGSVALGGKLFQAATTSTFKREVKEPGNFIKRFTDSIVQRRAKNVEGGDRVGGHEDAVSARHEKDQVRGSQIFEFNHRNQCVCF